MQFSSMTHTPKRTNAASRDNPNNYSELAARLPAGNYYTMIDIVTGEFLVYRLPGKAPDRGRVPGARATQEERGEVEAAQGVLDHGRRTRDHALVAAGARRVVQAAGRLDRRVSAARLRAINARNRARYGGPSDAA